MTTSTKPIRPWTFGLGGKSLLDLPSLQQIVDVLNGERDPQATDSLRTLVQLWKDADWNLAEMLNSHEDLSKLSEELGKLWRIHYFPDDRGGASLMPLFVGPTVMRSLGFGNISEILVAQYFGALTVLEWEKLGGPCARCHKYYIKRRASQKTYCSRRCGNAATASVRTAKQRKHERQANLEFAQKAIQQWKRAAKGTDWKVFVSRKTGLTPKWLTRAVGRNDLKAPKQEGS